MPYKLSDLINFVNFRIQDISGGTVDPEMIAQYGNEALRRIRRKFDVPPSEHRVQMDIFNGVYRYSCPGGYKDWTQILDRGVRPDNLNFSRTTESDFWRAYVDGRNYVADSRDGNARTLLIGLNQPRMSNIQLDSFDTYNYDGTWTADAASDATNVRTDTLDFLYGSGSVAFDITVAQSVNNYARLTKTMAQPKDLSSPTLDKVGVMFLDVYLPTAAITSMTLNWGSDSSDYYTSTVTAQWDGTAFATGWNTLGFDWATASKTGSPVDTQIKYLAFRADYLNTLTDQVGIRLDNLWCRQRKHIWFNFVSDYLVTDGDTDVLKESFTSGTDTDSYVSLDPSFVDLLNYYTLDPIFTFAIKDVDARAFNENLLQETEKDLIERHPSNRPPVSYSYTDTDELSDYLN